MMTDLAAGSRAAEQFQQDIAAAPYTQDLTQAASERKIQEDRLAKQYAPEEAAAKAEKLQFLRDQERINALYAPAKAATQQAEDTYKLQEQMNRAQAAETKRLFDAAGYKKDTESDEKLTTWMSSDDGKKANDIQRLEKAAQFKFDVGLITEGAALQKEVRARKTEDRANNIAKRLADNEILSTTDVIISKTPDDKVNETLARLPPEQLKLITDRTGVENWKNFTGKEKKEVLQRLFLSAKEQSALQLKELWAEVKESEIEARAQQKIDRDKKIEKDREEGKDSKNYQAFQRLDSSIERQNKSKIEDLDALVVEADEAMKAANKKSTSLLPWNNEVETERTTTTNAYNIAVQNAIDARRTSYEKRIRALKTIPDFDGKDEELESLERQLSKYPKKKETAPPPAAEIPAAAPASAAAPSATPTVTSNKYTEENPAKPTSKEEYDKLPGGSYYLQDGAIKQKSGGKVVEAAPASKTAVAPTPTATSTESVATSEAQPIRTQEDYDKQLRSILEDSTLDNKKRNVLIKELDAKFNTVKPATPAAAPTTITAKDTSTDFTGAKSADLIEPGNIDLTKRPVVKNKDGSISTVRSMSFEEDGLQILIPTVVGDKVVSNKDAIDYYHKTGEHLGVFSSVKAANAYAEKLHEEQDKMYSDKTDVEPAKKTSNVVTGKLIPYDNKSAVLKTPEDYRTYTMQEAKKVNLDANLVDNIFQIESEYNPKALSGTGSTGIAQFTKATGRYYGLTINDKVDERLDPIKSVKAALRFIADLNKKYKGNPELIAVAYNQGEPVLDAHLRKNNNNLVPGNLQKEIKAKLTSEGELSDKEIELRSNEPIKYLNKLRKMSGGNGEKSTAETLRELANMKQKGDALKRANDKKEKDIKELEKRNAKEKLKQLAGE